MVHGVVRVEAAAMDGMIVELLDEVIGVNVGCKSCHDVLEVQLVQLIDIKGDWELCVVVGEAGRGVG